MIIMILLYHQMMTVYVCMYVTVNFRYVQAGGGTGQAKGSGTVLGRSRNKRARPATPAAGLGGGRTKEARKSLSEGEGNGGCLPTCLRFFNNLLLACSAKEAS